MNSSIFSWKRMVIPAAPECLGDIDTAGPFFTLEDGESMVKHDSMINEDRNRRLIFMTSDKIMRAAAEMGHGCYFQGLFFIIFFRFILFCNHKKDEKGPLILF